MHIKKQQDTHLIKNIKIWKLVLPIYLFVFCTPSAFLHYKCVYIIAALTGYYFPHRLIILCTAGRPYCCNMLFALCGNESIQSITGCSNSHRNVYHFLYSSFFFCFFFSLLLVISMYVFFFSFFLPGVSDDSENEISISAVLFTISINLHWSWVLALCYVLCVMCSVRDMINDNNTVCIANGV